MDLEKIYVTNYKCFGKIELTNIRPINIIIGKNNIGKSSILDIIEMIYGVRKINDSTDIYLTKKMNQELIQSVFKSNVNGGSINGNHYEYGKKYINSELTFRRLNKNNNGDLKDFLEFNENLPNEQLTYWNDACRKIVIDSKIPKRILAERNVFAEDNDADMNVDSNGNGITRIITNYLNRDEYNENLVRETLLNQLNEIMGEDGNFTEITTQQVETSLGTKWELFLREEGKGRISLSNSGSGLKTILIVLVYTILVPDVEKKQISDYLFLFEELENNLHPSLQRRLLKYLENLTQKGAVFFLTTHSNVTLDSYQNSDVATIFHVQKKFDNKIVVNNVTNKIQKNSILNDLGVKASDLLQSNGIIWVEGPSDRIYINKWLEMNNFFDLHEGKDYQCVFYGGRLLSNLSLEDENDLINLLNINRNAIIVLDSDKKCINSSLNKTKKRILQEAEKNGIMVWVTKGREIENYIPENILKRYYGKEKSRQKFDRFQNIEEYIKKLKNGEDKKFLRNKTEFAKNILNGSKWEEFKSMYDLGKTILKIEETIYNWNHLD